MRDLIDAEWLKLRTTRMFYGNVLAALAMVPISVASAIHGAGRAGRAPLDTSEGVRSVLSAASSGTLIVLVIGILVMAGEFRHNTATSTFLIAPDRKRVVAAKLVASCLVGAGLAVAASALTIAIALPWLAAKDVEVGVLSGDVRGVLLGAMAATTLYALIGVGVGSLFRNQTAAVVIALVWVFAVEGILVSFVPEVGRWLPGGAVTAFTGVDTPEGGLLPVWTGVAVFTAYGLGFAAVGTRYLLRRDVA